MNFINDLFTKAVDVYNVNPYVFISLFFVSLPFYYGGYYLMIKIGYMYFKETYRAGQKFNINQLVQIKGFTKGLVINRFGWALPYLYLMAFGKNLPVWVYILIIFWIGLTAYLAVGQAHSKIINKSIKYMRVSGEDEIKAREFLAKRYGEVNFISKTEAKKPYYDEYVDSSVYFVARILGEVVGVIRIVNNSKVGLPILNDFKLDRNFIDKLNSYNQDKLVEIGNLAATPNQNIAKGLYKIVIKHCLKNKSIPLARIDKDLLVRLKKRYWLLRPFVKEIGKTKKYPGEICVPIKIKFNKFMLLFI